MVSQQSHSETLMHMEPVLQDQVEIIAGGACLGGLQKDKSELSSWQVKWAGQSSPNMFSAKKPSRKTFSGWLPAESKSLTMLWSLNQNCVSEQHRNHSWVHLQPAFNASHWSEGHVPYQIKPCVCECEQERNKGWKRERERKKKKRPKKNPSQISLCFPLLPLNLSWTLT